VKSENV